MTDIERNEPIKFHERGTLEAVTRWIANHYDGIAEWLKNVRRQYQVDRANVQEGHRLRFSCSKTPKARSPRGSASSMSAVARSKT